MSVIAICATVTPFVLHLGLYVGEVLKDDATFQQKLTWQERLGPHQLLHSCLAVRRVRVAGKEASVCFTLPLCFHPPLFFLEMHPGFFL